MRSDLRSWPSLSWAITTRIHHDEKWSILRSQRGGRVSGEGELRLVVFDEITSRNAGGHDDLLKRFGGPENF
jgi:hypothetical protein